jgi:hypothetical protein
MACPFSRQHIKAVRHGSLDRSFWRSMKDSRVSTSQTLSVFWQAHWSHL